MLGRLVVAGDGSYLQNILEMVRATKPRGHSHVPSMSWSLRSEVLFDHCPGDPGVIWKLTFPDGYTVKREGDRKFLLLGTDTEGRDLRVKIIFHGKAFSMKDVDDSPSVRNTVTDPLQRRRSATHRLHA